MIIVLTVLSLLAALAFFVVVAIFVSKISFHLESIGGSDSALSKISYGVRAIETETGGIAPQVTRLNRALGEAALGLKAIDETLVRIVGAAVAQGKP